MSAARDAILDSIAAANRRRAEAEPPESVRRRLSHPPAPPTPRWDEPDRVRFLQQLQAAAATYQHLDDRAAVASAIRAYVERQRLDQPVALAPHPLLQALPLPGARHGAVDPNDAVAVTVAYAGIAETGSLALISGADTPTGFNFLPEHLLCLLPAQHIVADLESLWRRLRAEPWWPPRAVNLVTGPSRTADVEQTIQLGAHGPRKLHLLLLEDTQ